MVIEFDFAWLDIQGRGAKGSTLTSHKVDRVVNAPKENGDEDTENTSSSPSAEKNEPPNSSKETKENISKEEKNASKGESGKERSTKSVPPVEKDPKNQATFEF